MLPTIVFFIAITTSQLFIFAILGEFYKKIVEKAFEIFVFTIIISLLWSWLYWLSH